MYAFGFMYLSEGIPYGFATTAMAMHMRMQGLSIEQIGAFVAAVLLPWGFKWAWAPLIDIVKFNRFGGRKAWLLICTVMMCITLITMAVVDFVANYQLIIWMVILNNIFGATQDVAIDSLAVSTLKDNERARANGFMFGGQYTGIAMGGGGAIFVSSVWGFDVSLMFVAAVLVAVLLFVIFFIKDPQVQKTEQAHQLGALTRFLSTFHQFFRNLYTGFMESGSGPKVGILFALLPVGAMALAYAILSTIQVDYGLSERQISQLSFAQAIVAAAGCLTGGFLGHRFGVKRMTALFYFLTIIPAIYLAAQIQLVGLVNIPINHLRATILTHGFLFGMAYAVRIAIFMGMTKPAVAATQFTTYMALSNIAISIGNLWQGAVAERFGYSLALYLDAAFIVVALSVMPFLKNREKKVKTADDVPVLAQSG
jgi:PAT family beta-lactamase induction signal transducer AmpG